MNQIFAFQPDSPTLVASFDSLQSAVHTQNTPALQAKIGSVGCNGLLRFDQTDFTVAKYPE